MGRLSTRLALFMVMITVLLQVGHGIYRFSMDIPQARQADLNDVNKMVASLSPALSAALYQYNETLSAEILKTFEGHSSAQAVWLLDDHDEGVSAWLRIESSDPQHWQEYRWPLYYQEQLMGYLIMVLDVNAAVLVASEIIWQQILISMLMGLMALVLMYWVVQHQVASPINELAFIVEDLTSRELQQEDLEILGQLKVNSELGVLRHAIKSMLSQLTSDLADKKQIMHILQEFNEQLEEKVEERTAELILAKDKAEVASRSKTDFLNSMTHEFRTPLNSILGFSALLKKQNLNEKNNMLINNVSEAGQQLLVLINDIFNFVDLDDKELERQKFAVYDVLNTAFLFAEKELKRINRNNDFTVLLEADKNTILKGDAQRLALSLRHILDNAIKFSQQGEIKIQCDVMPDESITIKVFDNGNGIDHTNLEALNQPFVQAEQGLDRSNEGTGLGLAIVQRICLKWGGVLKFEKNIPQGTVVVLNLPNLK